jgi:antitoxin component of RelBE/YafQ-DinJ toxin-antitoxin module
MPGRRRAAAPVVEEVDELEEIDELEEPADDDALEELEEEPDPAPAAKRTRGAKKAPAPLKKPPPTDPSEQFDSTWLAEHVTEETGVQYDSRAIRMLLRKLAKNGALAREVGEDRSRYIFPKGANDPTVRAVIKMVKSGEAAAVKREGLDKVQANRAAPAAKKTAPAATKKTAAPAKKAASAAPATRRRRTATQ